MFAKPVVQASDQVLAYLGRYVHRTAISESSLIACNERTVTFRYQDSRDQQRKTMTLPAHEFLRRFLQHVPPKGFHRVRSFGLLHPAHRITLRNLQLLLAPRRTPEPAATDCDPSPKTNSSRLVCPHCGQAALRLLRRLSAAQCIARERLAKTAPALLARAPPIPQTPSTAQAHP